ncbi:DUF58 domain-containing protein [Lysobacter humi (ex Lee et al. 2017)]
MRSPAAIAGLIPPSTRVALKDLRLVSRRAIGQHGIGLHRSLSRGSGLEFAQYRAYEPGDELRLVDWKLYARSDRFFVREAERESPLAVWILVDATASMGQGDDARAAWTRLHAARVLAACIAELALRQGDRFGLATLRGDGVGVITPAATSRQRDRIVQVLQALDAAGRWPDDARTRPLWERIRPGDMVILLGDLLDDAAIDVATRLAAARRDVLAIAIQTAEERDFPFEGGHRFRDPETGEELLGDGAAMRDEFLARFGAAREAMRVRLEAAGIRHATHVLDEPPEHALRRLFAVDTAAARA